MSKGAGLPRCTALAGTFAMHNHFIIRSAQPLQMQHYLPRILFVHRMDPPVCSAPKSLIGFHLPCHFILSTVTKSVYLVLQIAKRRCLNLL